MTGIEPRTSGIGSDRYTNWATTTAMICEFIIVIKINQMQKQTPKVQLPERVFLCVLMLWTQFRKGATT